MFDLPETVTYWKFLGSDGLGGSSWGAPTTTASRIAYKQERFTDANGNDSISKAVCYVDIELIDGDYVFFGVTTDLAPNSESNDVRAYAVTPSGAGSLRKLWF